MGLSFWVSRLTRKILRSLKTLIFSIRFSVSLKITVEDIKPEKLIKTGIDDMLESLDPYTTISPKKIWMILNS